jgi:hypothetical protein
MIGIKIADGTYIPILDEFEQDKKKVILTTVRDDQPSVQIDLYRGEGSGMDNPRFLDTLKIDKITEALKGEPEIELVLGVDDEGKLIATVKDLQGENEESFSISLDAPAREPLSSGEEPDFELSGDKPETAGETPPSYSPMNGQSVSIHERKNRTPLLVAAILALLAAAGVLCWYFLLRTRGEDQTASTPAAPPAVAAPAKPVEPQPVVPAPQPVPAQPAAPRKPADSPEKTSQPGVWYSIVKGDNLWNLSKSFYRNPWLYPKIAKENKIPNPDLIYRGNRIYIPDVETDKNKK